MTELAEGRPVLGIQRLFESGIASDGAVSTMFAPLAEYNR